MYHALPPAQAANLLLDETGTVKIADFGVARVMDHTGIMTAETGTYRCGRSQYSCCIEWVHGTVVGNHAILLQLRACSDMQGCAEYMMQVDGTRGH